MNPMDRKPIPLTEEEKKNPISKYYTEQITPPNPELMGILLSGPMNPEDSIKPEEARKLLAPGYMKTETGYCIMDNRCGYLCVNNRFPGLTLDMIKWWFAWHPLESLRYKIWNPYCHPYAAIADCDREKIMDMSVPIEDKIADVVHFVVENIGAGMQDIVIHFEKPECFGFTKEELKEAHSYAIGGYGLVENREGEKGKLPVIMLHYFREIEGGVETRTRFWMGYRIVKGHPVCVLPEGVTVPIEAPMGLAMHNVEEFGHLASFLPRIYAEFGENKPIC